MKIAESKPFKLHLAACEKRFGKGKMGYVSTTRPISADIMAKCAQDVYDALTGHGLTYLDTVLIREIVWEQLEIDRNSKTL